MKKITREMLKRYGACTNQLRLFNQYYPKGIKITVEDFTIAQSLGLDVTWTARLLSPVGSLGDAERIYIHWHGWRTDEWYTAAAFDAQIACLVDLLQRHKYDPGQFGFTRPGFLRAHE